jgi:hypothetical protein
LEEMGAREFKLLWMMVYFRELPVPLQDIDPAFIDIFFNFATTYTEESVLYSEIKRREKPKTSMTADEFREMGYSEKMIAEMDLDDHSSDII